MYGRGKIMCFKIRNHSFRWYLFPLSLIVILLYILSSVSKHVKNSNSSLFHGPGFQMTDSMMVNGQQSGMSIPVRPLQNFEIIHKGEVIDFPDDDDDDVVRFDKDLSKEIEIDKKPSTVSPHSRTTHSSGLRRSTLSTISTPNEFEIISNISIPLVKVNKVQCQKLFENDEAEVDKAQEYQSEHKKRVSSTLKYYIKYTVINHGKIMFIMVVDTW